MAELSIGTIVAATRGRLTGEPAPCLFPGVSTDTRTLSPGELYVALKGERFDGHDFALDAMSRGAGALLVSRPLQVFAPQIVVEDTLRALGEIAAAHRAPLSLKVIAITGSVGKTSTKEMAAAIAAQGWRTAKTPGNLNNEIGVPLTLLGLTAAEQALVVELAMRGRGQIAYLAQMVGPQVGVITNVGVSHLELLGTRQAIAEAKAEVLEALPADGTAVLNADDEWYQFLAARSPAPVVSFGTAEGADVRVSEVALTDDGRARFRLSGRLVEAEVTSGAVGRHQAMNAAAAAAAALAAGADPAWVAPGLASSQGEQMRGRIVQAPRGYTVLDDSYNAAPDSMRAALSLLVDLPGNRKWAALGDMKELGPASADEHRAVGGFAAGLGLAGLVTVGELGRHIAEGAAGLGDVTATADNAAAAAALEERLAAGDVVLVKGSRAMQMEQIVAALLGQEAAGHA
jgi:UDP-N-acetylmuramoyl-tripeptide--D-alanyl-D-alanine ligase